MIDSMMVLERIRDVEISTHGLVLSGVVLAAHYAAHGLHTVAHVEIPVVLSGGVTAGTLLVVYGLPAVGLGLLWRGSVRTGTAAFTVAMALPFLLGVMLHYGVPNPDHVSAVPGGQWQGTFRATAAAAAVVDGSGTVVGAWLLWSLDTGTDDRHPGSGRVEGVPASGFRPLTRLSYWFAGRLFGDIPEPLAVTAHHGRVFAGYNAFEAALSGADVVDERLTELAVLKAATRVGCEFCIDIGTAEARELGITDAQLRDVHRFEDSDAFTERERLVLRYADALSSTPVDVSDDCFEALAAAFDEPELVELTAAIAFENYRARFNRAFGIEPQGFSEGVSCPRPAAAIDRTGGTPADGEPWVGE